MHSTESEGMSDGKMKGGERVEEYTHPTRQRWVMSVFFSRSRECLARVRTPLLVPYICQHWQQLVISSGRSAGKTVCFADFFFRHATPTRDFAQRKPPLERYARTAFRTPLPALLAPLMLLLCWLSPRRARALQPDQGTKGRSAIMIGHPCFDNQVGPPWCF